MAHPNVRDRVEPARLAEEQAALRRVATLVARGASPAEVFEIVAAEVASLLGSDFSLIGRYETDATLTHVASHPPDLLSQLGPRTILDGDDLASLVQRSGKPTSINYDDAPGPVAALARELGVRCAVGAPIQVEDQIWGVMAAGWAMPEKASAEAAERTAEFTALVATALANTESRNEITRLAEGQAALRRVATLVAQGAPPAEVFESVVTEVGQLFPGANAAALSRYETDDTLTMIGRWSRADGYVPVGARYPLVEGTVGRLIEETRLPGRIDVDAEALRSLPAVIRDLGWVSVVGAPIFVEGRLWGLVGISSTTEQSLPSHTEHRLTEFTELLGSAIANAESREALAKLAEEQAALHRLAMLVAEGVPAQDIFDAVCQETSQLLGARAVNLSHYTSDGFNLTMAGTHLPVGTRVPIEPNTVAGAIIRTRAPARVDDWDDQPGQLAGLLRDLGVRSSLGVPIFVEGRLWGALAAGTDEDKPLPAGTEARLGSFAELLATAISNAATRTALIESRARIVAAGDEARHRIERNLHDGTQQRLIALGLDVQRVRATIPEEQNDTHLELERVETALETVLEELRVLSRGLHPPLLARRGLPSSLRALARDSPIPVELEIDLPERPPAPLEIGVYYVVSEALTNAIKHSQASAISITIETRADLDGRSRGHKLYATIADDGVGGADASAGSGLTGLADRVEALGGRFALDTPINGGTRISIELPLEAPLAEPTRE